MKRFLKGFGSWVFFNSLYGWAVWSACIMLSPIGYNFLVWGTAVLMTLQVLSVFGLSVMKNSDPETFAYHQDNYNKSWHINKYVDILYSMVVLSVMLYGGFLGIATMYLINEIMQNVIKSLLGIDTEPTSEEIVSQYDDSVLDRIGINRNERGR